MRIRFLQANSTDTDHNECIQRRRKFKDAASIEVLDRLESLNENEWGSAEIKWHKTCYSSLTSEHHIQRLEKKADILKVPETQTNEPASRSGRRSLDPVDWTKCMFCQAVKR